MNRWFRQLAAISQQLARNLRHTLVTQAVVLGTVTLAVLVFGFFYLLSVNVKEVGTLVQREVRMDVFLTAELPDEVRRAMEEKIRAFAPIDRIDYVPQQAAMDRLRQRLGDEADILADLPADLLPATLEVYPRTTLTGLAPLDELAAWLRHLPGVEKVEYGRQWLRHLLAFSRLVRLVTVLAGVLLVLTATFTIAATIRLTIFIRRGEIQILTLLGASASYVRLPLLVEGFLLGLTGSALGLASLWALYHWLYRAYASQGTLLGFTPHFLTPMEVTAIGAATTCLCLTGGLVSLRRAITTA